MVMAKTKTFLAVVLLTLAMSGLALFGFSLTSDLNVQDTESHMIQVQATNHVFPPSVPNHTDDAPKHQAEGYVIQPTREHKKGFDDIINYETSQTAKQSLKALRKYLTPIWQEMRAVSNAFLNLSISAPYNGKAPLIVEKNQSSFFAKVERYPRSIKLIRLEAQPELIAPYLIHDAFPITRDTCNMTPSVYSLIRKGPMVNHTPEKRFQPCQTDKKRGLCKERPDWLYPKESTGNGTKLWSYVAVVKDGCVSSLGNYRSNEFIVRIKKCKDHLGSLPRKSPKYDEIFSVAQFWGYGFGHWTTEDLPRLGPYVDYLRQNTQIKIHAPTKSGFIKAWLNALGISGDRVISGYNCARVLYVPEGTKCAGGDAFYPQMLSLYIREHTLPVEPQERRNIVFIERTRSRVMRNRKSMYAALKELAHASNLTVELFSDSKLPSMNKTRDIFNKAFLIFTNHGAGQGNMILAPPGTVIVECSIMKGMANASFHKYGYALGHKVFTYISKDCYSISAKDLMIHVKEYLRMREDIVSNTCPYDSDE